MTGGKAEYSLFASFQALILLLANSGIEYKFTACSLGAYSPLVATSGPQAATTGFWASVSSCVKVRGLNEMVTEALTRSKIHL